MRFHAKALVQRVVSLLPNRIANEVYFIIQRRWGRLQKVDPTNYFRQALLLIKMSHQKWPTGGPDVMEVGTGRTVNVPFAFWLAGAKSITTYDLNRYLRSELVEESLAGAREHRALLESMFRASGIPVIPERWDALLNCTTAADALAVANVKYCGPGDATQTRLPEASIDLHISVNVFEHVPPPILTSILAEANRVLRRSGRITHTVDPSDHFAQTDKTLNPINFLRYSQEEWNRISGNQFMYQNRLRASDYLALLERGRFKLESIDTLQDATARAALAAGFKVHSDYSHFSAEDLITVKLDFSAHPL
jgi:hypothetical protein